MKMKSPHEAAVQAILYGHSCAIQLKLRLDDPNANDKSISSYDLAQSIAKCFSNAISILSHKPKSEDYQFSNLSSIDPSDPPLPQRSQSKKRKIISTNSNENWRDDSPVPIYHDGFIWRKYGQKSIKKSKHQRNYYRCSYNIDHDCKARKHEQKIKDNPPVYRTTYFGHHTCKINYNQNSDFTTIIDPVDDLKSAKMIRFEKESHSGGFSLSVKQDNVKKETVDMYREITGNDQDCQYVLEENLSSDSYPPLSSSGSIGSDSDLFLDNVLDSWDPYDQFDLGFH